MQRRPWPIVILAALHVLAPVPNILMGAYLLNESVGNALVRIFQYYSPFDLFRAFFFFPLAGVAIYLFRSWSYWTYLAIMGGSFYMNFMKWLHSSGSFTLSLLLMSYAINIFLVSYFLLPAVRAVYFNPRLRWWESKPRYKLRLVATLCLQDGEFKCGITDISEGGLFFQAGRHFELNDPVAIKFSVFNMHLHVRGTVVHTGDMHRPGYGVRFSGLDPATLIRLRQLMRGFAVMGLEQRQKRTTWYVDFKNWLVQAVKTGRGLVPEVPGIRGHAHARADESQQGAKILRLPLPLSEVAHENVALQVNRTAFKMAATIMTPPASAKELSPQSWAEPPHHDNVIVLPIAHKKSSRSVSGVRKKTARTRTSVARKPSSRRSAVVKKVA